MPEDEPQRGEPIIENTNGAELRGIYDKFKTLSAEMEVSNDTILALIATTEQINGYRFSVLTKEQDGDLFREIARVNKLLGKARTMLDSYILLENSTPNFKNHFNLIYDLMKLTEKQRETIFFEYHVTHNDRYPFPTRVLENMLRELTGLFGRLGGTLEGTAEYILDSPLLAGARDNGSSYNSSYSSPSSRNRGTGTQYPEEGVQSDERDLGM